MTITRILTAGFESNGTDPLAELPLRVGSPTYSTSTVKTGTYAFRCIASQDYCAGATFPATRQLRMGFHAILSVNQVSGSHDHHELRIQDGANNPLVALVGTYTGAITALVNGTNRGTILAPPPRVWQHIGIDVKIHATAGWCYIYVDGTQMLGFNGNTGNADLVSFYIGAWSLAMYSNCAEDIFFDNLYIDDTTGEAAPARPPAYQYLGVVANGNGATSGFTGSDGDATDNYALVDEAPHNSDTDFVKALAADVKDTYAMTTQTIPAGMTAIAVIPFAWARKAGTEDVQLKTVVRSGSTEALGTAKALATTYAMIQGLRQTTDPNTAAAWEQAGIDAMEVGVQSAGTYA